VRIFGIDPGSERTGYGCVESDGRRHRLVTFGAISASARDSFPERLARIHRELSKVLAACRPECVAVENIFHAANVRSALKLGHARGVAMLAAIEAGCLLVEYSPAEVKRAVVGYGRAEKGQVQQMVKLLLGLREAPAPHDAADALAVAICHLHTASPRVAAVRAGAGVRAGQKPGAAADPLRAATDPRRVAKADLNRGLNGKHGSGALRGQRALRSWRDYRPPAGG
jgi:crossover junction endodeoxyribonuclease RuvC